MDWEDIGKVSKTEERKKGYELLEKDPVFAEEETQKIQAYEELLC